MANSGNRKAGSRHRTMTKPDTGSNITYVNAAIVPRVVGEYEFEAQEEGDREVTSEDAEVVGRELDFGATELDEVIVDGVSETEEVGVSNTVHHFACVEVSLRDPVRCVRGADVWVRIVDGLDGGGKRVVRAQIAKQTPRIMPQPTESLIV